MNYLNENDPVMAAWLRELIAEKVIANGVVDERSIEDVTPADLAGFTQCHFFAGIGGWLEALAIAGVPSTTKLWTGSCPCQPFSKAGKGEGFADERHLWPAWYWLIEQCKPAIVLGEQVAQRTADQWVDLVHADMEALDYAFGCVAFPAAGIGAPNLRDRLYWMGRANGSRLEGHAGHGTTRATGSGSVAASGVLGIVADTNRNGCDSPSIIRLPNEQHHPQSRGCVDGFWRDADWISCRDGKYRPVEPGTFPLAHGIPARVGRLRGYGNAINPYQAAAFVEVAMSWR